MPVSASLGFRLNAQDGLDLGRPHNILRKDIYMQSCTWDVNKNFPKKLNFGKLSQKNQIPLAGFLVAVSLALDYGPEQRKSALK